MSLIVVARNTTELSPISDYEYKVLVGDGSPEGSHTITSGQIKGHKRSDGWKTLISRIVEESE